MPHPWIVLIAIAAAITIYVVWAIRHPGQPTLEVRVVLAFPELPSDSPSADPPSTDPPSAAAQVVAQAEVALGDDVLGPAIERIVGESLEPALLAKYAQAWRARAAVALDPAARVLELRLSGTDAEIALAEVRAWTASYRSVVGSLGLATREVEPPTLVPSGPR